MLNNKITELLNIDYPIIQAPMAGGISTTALVSSVSNYGGLGMIGAGYMNAIQTRDQIREVRQTTSNNFGVNLFVPTEFQRSDEKIRLADDLLSPIREQLEIENSKISTPTYESLLESFNAQVDVVIEEKVPICSFTFGIPNLEIINRLKQHNIIVIGTATTVSEAIEIERTGMDLIVVQGSEAGGHRGTFINDGQESLVGLMSLIPQVVDNVMIPVIAAGGIMDGRGLIASLCLGAKGVQMGTAFLTCMESGAHELHKEAILHSSEDQTVLTRAFSGKWARGVKNKFIKDLHEDERALPDFPIQNSLTQDIRKAASLQNNRDFMSLWSGQSPRLAKNQSVEMLMKKIVDEAIKIKNS
ncbi:NAD(P)H-dependent flavin oxidoreductase [Lederbergia wuyishanensis]|uniref:Probable nitronate monooxygenase n=1 Tax=Lederbergia wuyishanensis TaxID=1347903 RepID=A0ABU0D5S1_9BACI|nr:nitronate monooxygenase [Lederbergia wuyishanensis]MCJ8008329.1 nitronate monooxygenase [Lederbergia wuyishanensis]MDQ0343741.1 nitronate monooxygenase [Lederbergia wuyishanensis]